MLKYGFELEGFALTEDALDVVVPPKDYPVDGFPGLVEIRTSGYASLEEAYARVIAGSIPYYDVDFATFEAVFTPQQRAELRRREERKSQWDIQNIYGKYPRPLGNRTIASCQLNISELLAESRTDDKGVFHPARFGLFDVPRIIRALDEEFKNEIKEARRQPGEYCIKDVRLEYRSLPNFAFVFDPREAKDFLGRIKQCVEGAK